MKIYLAIASLLAALAGCSESTQTVEWYKEHEAERKTMLEKCRNNPGDLAASPNCVNARQAQKRLEHSAPVDFSAGSPELKKFAEEKGK